MINTWDDLTFWSYGEWQAIQERLEGTKYCPGKERLFAALDEVPFDEVKVMIVGQDPYPDLDMATGVAFSIPKGIAPAKFPRTLRNILIEAKEDLHLNAATTGNLEKWTAQGVLLWNAYPSCKVGEPSSHRWPEWELLTQEIIENLTQKYVVFVFLGSLAHTFAKFVNTDYGEVLCFSHPSPRAGLKSRAPFIGSRVFSTINMKLKDQGQEPIDWQL